jgi:hypothetical protein
VSEPLISMVESRIMAKSLGIDEVASNDDA